MLTVIVKKSFNLKYQTYKAKYCSIAGGQVKWNSLHSWWASEAKSTGRSQVSCSQLTWHCPVLRTQGPLMYCFPTLQCPIDADVPFSHLMAEQICHWPCVGIYYYMLLHITTHQWSQCAWAAACRGRPSHYAWRAEEGDYCFRNLCETGDESWQFSSGGSTARWACQNLLL